jgi:hypothetical protein
MKGKRQLRSNRVSKKRPLTEKQIQSLVDETSSIWNKHKVRGIEVRHREGRVLNRRLGSPSDRQSYGKEVVKRVAKKLGVPLCEVYRWRKIADVEPDVKKFLADHPKITTWTAVKEYLGKSKAGGRRKSRKPVKQSITGVKNSIRSFAERVQKWKSIPLDSQRELRDELRDLLSALRGTFGVTLRSETERTPSAENESVPLSPIVVSWTSY